MNASALRSQLKTQRLDTPLEEQQAHAKRIGEQICLQDFFNNSQHIAFYLPVQGEVDTRLLVERARELGKQCYLPVLAPDDRLHLCFMPFNPGTKFVSNRFKIPEPQFDESKMIAPDNLDLVITPLLAFDKSCNRLGMGLGFYDRTFGFLQASSRPSQPILCGLAYAFQEVDSTEPKPWDVSLDFVVTELKIHSRAI
jgi:5-formyltetrahydrofolate cyclo-ligase